ncbi:sensor histidine kinase [Labrys miyagiensis]|uniref:histidine kinase n=1 Tax=Labrys miyagiensis TaxID=346912 RepID=A0ABQ6C9R7_9HYPH|nr:sensor histidine kinase [Labrys miyagiensis]GLS17132.1 sensor histidine kinase [Labrys miyagiensis]
MSRSLRRELLGWLVLPLTAVVSYNVWNSYSDARETADLLTDRTLISSARSIAENIHESDGVIQAPIPPSALEMFATDDRDHVIYRVNGPRGELVAGYPDTLPPPETPTNFRHIYFKGSYRGEAVRAVALAQPVVSATGKSGEALVIVGQTLRSHDRLVNNLWLRALRDEMLLVAVAGILALLGLRRGLTPLLRLRDEVRQRGPDTLEPLDTTDVQTELRPLVTALNEALAQVQRQVAAQRRFVANAAHQLRTPLALLKAQVGVGLRAPDAPAARESLTAAGATVEGMTRLSNQLLSLARAEQGSALLHREKVDFNALCRDAVEDLAIMAVERGIDLGFDGAPAPLQVNGHPTLLREMATNLVENALRYTPKGGTVTARVRAAGGSTVTLRVEDDGPGIPADEREKVFERFYRRLGTGIEGTGLGLAVVKEIVSSHEGEIELADNAPPPGLLVKVTLPALEA